MSERCRHCGVLPAKDKLRGFLGGIIPAVEKRVKVVVLNVGGMEMEKALPEVDQINYLPRVTQPVLMLNGKYDMYFPDGAWPGA
jgi:hypothetical protein